MSQQPKTLACARSHRHAFVLAPRALGKSGRKLDYLPAKSPQIDTKPLENPYGHAGALTSQAEKQMFGTDVVMTELHRLSERKLKDLLHPWCKGG